MQPLKLRKISFLTGNDFAYEGKLPIRMLYLRDEPEYITDPYATAYNALAAIHNYLPLIFTDIYRSPASSAEAYARKTGVAKPGYSGHNYGVSVDIAVDACLQRHSISYPDLVGSMIAFGWTPYQGARLDSAYKRGKEDWHFNYIGDCSGSGSAQVNTWINKNIVFETDLLSIQRMLTELKFYQGEIDGLPGKFTTEAIRKFQSAWAPKAFGASGKLDELTVRLINIVSCKIESND